MPHPRERLARRPPDHPVKLPHWRMEGLDVPAPEEIGPSDHAEPLFLEGAIKEPNSREETEDQGHGHPTSPHHTSRRNHAVTKPSAASPRTRRRASRPRMVPPPSVHSISAPPGMEDIRIRNAITVETRWKLRPRLRRPPDVRPARWKHCHSRP